MIDQIELLDGIMKEMISAKEILFKESREIYDGNPGMSVDEINAHYRANYQATQDVLMECYLKLAQVVYELKNK